MRRRAEQLLVEVGTRHRLRHPVGKLSGGERQRVAVARALVLEPRLVLADEPTGNLDPKTADQVLELLLEMNREHGTALVVVTHSPELAARLGRRVELVDGYLEECRSRSRVRPSPERFGASGRKGCAHIAPAARARGAARGLPPSPCSRRSSPAGPASAQPAAEPDAPPAPAGATPRIAVLGFAVQSADADPDLGARLARELAAILAEDGRVALVDEAVRITPPEPQPGETRDAALRRLGAGLGADYLVTGRATELVRGGGFDLAVRMTPLALGESDTQVVTADDEKALVARLGEVAASVVSRVVGAPPARIVAVNITGAPGFESRAAGAAGHPRRSALRPARGARRPRPAARERGAPVGGRAHRAQRRRRRGPLRRRARAPVGARAEGGRGDRRDQGARQPPDRGRRDPRAHRARRPASRFDPARVAERHRADPRARLLPGRPRVSRTRARPARVLIFEVEENPVVRQISISGNENIDSDKIRDILTLTTGSTLDYPLLFENRERIEALYRAEGYYLAEVRLRDRAAAASRVGRHQLRGRRGREAQAARDRLRRQRALQRRRAARGLPDQHLALLVLRDLLVRQVGHLLGAALRPGPAQRRAAVHGLGLPAGGGGRAGGGRRKRTAWSCTVPIQEGSRFRVGKIDIARRRHRGHRRAARRSSSSKTGDVFNRSYLNDGRRRRSREHYSDRGFYFAKVTPLSNLSQADGGRRRRPSRCARARSTSCATSTSRGNTITVDPVIRREIPIVEGQLYSQRAVLPARTRIERLGFFEEVDLEDRAHRRARPARSGRRAWSSGRPARSASAPATRRRTASC